MAKKRTKKKTNTGLPAGTLVNLPRAAELLGVAYDTVKKATDDGVLGVAHRFQTTKGAARVLVTIKALDEYRLGLVARYETQPTYADRAKRLGELTLLAA